MDLPTRSYGSKLVALKRAEEHFFHHVIVSLPEDQMGT